MKVGILTGGGDCPGLNAVIRAVARRVADAGGECVGFLEGWRGMVRGMSKPLAADELEPWLGRGGTVLGSSRTNPYKDPEADLPNLRRHFAEAGLDALVVVGGDDTLGVAARLVNDFGMPIVGVPKTIDNDLALADFSFGFDTAVNVVVEAVERLRTTAESHRRVIVAETMGRTAGWLACFAGMAVGADYVLVPEVPVDVPHLIESLRRRREAGRDHAIVLAAEGARLPDPDPDPDPDAAAPEALEPPRPGGIGATLAGAIARRLDVETRTVVLGHLQRGGAPTAHDRVLATRMGLAAAELVLRGRVGTVLTIRGAQIDDVPLDSRALAVRPLDLAFYQDAAAFFY